MDVWVVIANTYSVEEVNCLATGLVGVFTTRKEADKAVSEIAIKEIGVTEEDFIYDLDAEFMPNLGMVFIPVNSDGKWEIDANGENVNTYDIQFVIKKTELNKVLHRFD